MNKLLVFVGSLLVSLPLMTFAVNNGASEDQTLLAASYQQGESAADPAPPVVTKSSSSDATPEVPGPQVASNPDKTPPAVAVNVENNDISQALMVLTQQMNELQSNQSEVQQQQADIQQALDKQQYLLLALAILLFIFGILLLMVYRKKKLVNAKTEKIVIGSKTEDDTQAEYDFMGSSEAIPAKLDLARAYIAMEDYTAARETLAEILDEGNEENRQEAETLLSKINT